MKKLTQEYVENYIKNEGWNIKSVYKNSSIKIELVCPEGHVQYKRFNDFQQGKRCSLCSGNNKKTYDEIKEYIESEYGYKLHTTKQEFNNFNMNSLSLYTIECKNGHIYKSNFDNFKNKNKRCQKCYFLDNTGPTHPKYNPNKILSLKLRNVFKRNWINKNMKHDPNYVNYIKDPNKYCLDHIIPVKAFSDYLSELNFNFNDDFYILRELKKVVNNIDNLQLLLKEDNRKKHDQYDKSNLIKYLKKFKINDIIV